MRSTKSLLLVLLMAISLGSFSQVSKAFKVPEALHQRSASNDENGGYDCGQEVESDCNHIPNPEFYMAPYPYSPYGWGAFVDPFYVYKWKGALGSADINGAVATIPVSHPFFATNANFASMLAWQRVQQPYTDPDGNAHPYDNLALAEGISARIKPVEAGREYALSFYLNAKPQDGWPPIQNFRFKIILAHCDEFPEFDNGENFPDSYLSPPPYPDNYQVVFCETIEGGDFDWIQNLVKFKAESDWNLIWILPETSADFNQDLDGTFFSMIHLAYPELVRFGAGDLETNDCEGVIPGYGCGIIDGMYTWYDPAGNAVHQGDHAVPLDVTAGMAGHYTLTLEIPSSPAIGQNCLDGDINPFANYMISSSTYVPAQEGCGELSVSGIGGYYAYTCEEGYLGEYEMDLTQFGPNDFCFNTNELLWFKLESNQPNDNMWKYNILSGGTTFTVTDQGFSGPIPAGTYFHYDPDMFVYVTLSPQESGIIEFVVYNTALNETRSIIVRVNSIDNLSSPYCYCEGYKKPVFSQNLSNVLDEITVFPNPTTGILNFKAKNSFDEIQIFNLSGSLMRRQRENKINGVIDLSSLPAGAYMAVFRSKGKMIQKKMVVKK